ncbi:MAG: uncharacterized protein QOJ85_2497 [Solirubrobacteraceae bacterium]|jgi:uncharacterized protein with von Willebrand factor type A (vWA) domain|nr:uncharacterized protein [Solirubrobacteraceae bacterium]MEA2241878.1 uncharacterized protein [Solirubrobacteraceae bacterium]
MNDAQITCEPERTQAHHSRVLSGDETLDLDLPAVAAALSQRLHAAGVPVTPGRAASFADAMTLVGPASRGRLYCTARAVFVSAHAQLPAFDRVFASVFAGDQAHESPAARSSAATAPGPVSGPRWPGQTV